MTMMTKWRYCWSVAIFNNTSLSYKTDSLTKIFFKLGWRKTLFHRNHCVYRWMKTGTDLWDKMTAKCYRHIINIYLKLAFIAVAVLYFRSLTRRKTTYIDIRLVTEISGRVWRYQSGNQNPYIEEEQTTQWPKEKVQKGKTRIYKTYT